MSLIHLLTAIVTGLLTVGPFLLAVWLVVALLLAAVILFCFIALILSCGIGAGIEVLDRLER